MSSNNSSNNNSTFNNSTQTIIATTMYEQKKQLRKIMTTLLKNTTILSEIEINQQSSMVTAQVMKHVILQQQHRITSTTTTSSSSPNHKRLILQSNLSNPTNNNNNKLVVCAYLAMPREIQTSQLITLLHQMNECRVCVPVMLDDQNLKMVEINREENIDEMERDKWGIPILSHSMERPEINVHNIDIVLTPGLAFDRHGGRLGRGKGYYDTYFHRVDTARIEHGLSPCLKVGIGFTQQLLDKDIPMSDNDVFVDTICIPNEFIVVDKKKIQLTTNEDKEKIVQ
jgi:5-formyltetrahydrofolate cyclo-ligase